MRVRQSSRKSVESLWIRLVVLIPALVVLAAACAPEEEEEVAPPPEMEEEAPPTGVEIPELQDSFSVQHREWAGQTVDTSEFKTDPPYSIATIVQGPTNGWGTIFDTVMNYELEQSGLIEDQLYVPWDFTTESQANGIDDAIAKDVDIILLTSLSRAGLVEPVQRAVDAGIPVLTCMATVEGDAPTADVSRNIPAQGYQSAKLLAEGIGGEGKVVLLHGIAGVDAAEFWRSGALAALDEFPGIEVVAEEFGNWSVADSLDVMRAVLTAQPDIDGVWIGGLEMGVSVINAFNEANREIPPISGANPINGFLRLAIENEVTFFADPFPSSASQLCVETMFKILRGEPIPRFTEVAGAFPGTEAYTQDEAEEHYRSDFNDDWIGPGVIPDEAYLEAGFGA